MNIERLMELTEKYLDIRNWCSESHESSIDYPPQGNWRVETRWLWLGETELQRQTRPASDSLSSKSMATHVLDHALRTTAIEKLKGKRIVLASNSPRRKEILHTLVRPWQFIIIDHRLSPVSKSQGIAPDIVPSTFEENLDYYSFPQPHEYPVATATHKAVQVYEKLVVSPCSCLVWDTMTIYSVRWKTQTMHLTLS